MQKSVADMIKIPTNNRMGGGSKEEESEGEEKEWGEKG